MAYEVGFIVYLVTCSVTGKVYVGQTSQGLPRRWSHHRHMALSGKTGGSSALHAAIRKYGVDKFTTSVLATCDTREEANVAEEAWIYALGSQAPGGYNLKAGGQASEHSPETRAKMSASAKARGNNRKGYRHTAETKERMRRASRAQQHPVGWSHTPEAKARMVASRRARYGL